MKIDLKIYNDYLKRGLLIKNKHPEYDISIWNYSRLVQYDNNWDDITLSTRSMIIDDNTGEILGLSFKKFFNIEQEHNLDLSQNFKFYDKMDGSLIILFYYNNMWLVASSGSFISAQAIAANSLIQPRTSNLDPNLTYIFEYISPWNRIVVDYGDMEDVVLLSAFETNTGKELELSDIVCDFNKVKEYDINYDINKLREIISNGAEGFVVKFNDGNRVKIKSAEYFRLHRIITQCSSYDIYDILKSGNDINDIIDNVPDEFFDWVKNTIKKIQDNYDNILNKHIEMFNKIKHIDNAKDYFIEINKLEDYNRSILMCMYNNKNYNTQIWRMVKPEYELPYNNIINDKN